MQQSIVGQDNIHPYKFSECSLDDYISGFRESRSMCLLNKPNEVYIFFEYREKICQIPMIKKKI